MNIKPITDFKDTLKNLKDGEIFLYTRKKGKLFFTNFPSPEKNKEVEDLGLMVSLFIAGYKKIFNLNIPTIMVNPTIHKDNFLGKYLKLYIKE